MAQREIGLSSLDNLLPVDQCREIEADNVHL